VLGLRVRWHSLGAFSLVHFPALILCTFSVVHFLSLMLWCTLFETIVTVVVRLDM